MIGEIVYLFLFLILLVCSFDFTKMRKRTNQSFEQSEKVISLLEEIKIKKLNFFNYMVH